MNAAAVSVVSLIVAAVAILIAAAAITISILNMNQSGPTGPQGPTGSTGATGPTGPIGLNNGSQFKFNNGINGNINMSNYNSSFPYMTSVLSDQYMYLTGNPTSQPSLIVEHDTNLNPGQSFFINTGQIPNNSSVVISSNYYLISGNPINIPIILNPQHVFMFTLANDKLTLIVSYWSAVILVNNPHQPPNISVPPNIKIPPNIPPNISVPPPNISVPPPNIHVPPNIPPNISVPPNIAPNIAPNISVPPPNIHVPPNIASNISVPPPNIAPNIASNISVPPPNIAPDINVSVLDTNIYIPPSNINISSRNMQIKSTDENICMADCGSQLNTKQQRKSFTSTKFNKQNLLLKKIKAN